MIDRLATVGPDDRDHLAAVLENLRAHRRVDLVVAVLGTRRRPTRCTRSARSPGIDVVAVLTQPAALAPRRVGRRRRRVDHAVRRPRGTQALTAHASRVASIAARRRMARRARSSRRSRSPRQRRSPRCRSAASSTPAGSCCPCSAPRCSPTRRRAGPSPRVAGVDRRRAGAGRPRRVRRRRARARRRNTFGISPRATRGDALDRQLSGGWHTAAHRARARARPPTAPSSSRCSRSWAMAAIADWLAFARQAPSARIAPALVFFVWTSTLGTERLAARAHRRLLRRPPARSSSRRTSRVLDRRRSWLVSQRRRAPALARARGARSARGAVVVALVLARCSRARAPIRSLDVANTGRDDRARPQLPAGVRAVRRRRREARRRRRPASCSPCDAASPTTGASPRSTSTPATAAASGRSSAEGDDKVKVGLPTRAIPAARCCSSSPSARSASAGSPPRSARSRSTSPDTLVGEVVDTLVADAPRCSGLDYTVESELAPLAGTQFTAEQTAATAAAVPPRPRAVTPRCPPTSPTRRRSTRLAEQVVDDAGATTRTRRPRRSATTSAAPRSSTTPGRQPRQQLRDPRVPPHQARVLRAVRERVRGDGARARDPRARRGRASRPGTRGDGTLHVTSHDAHAWPEIWLTGLGWTHLFDPTPAQQGDTAGGSALPDDTAAGRRRRPPRPDRHDDARRSPGPPAAAAAPGPRDRRRPRRAHAHARARADRRRRATRSARGWSWSSCWSRWRSLVGAVRRRGARAPSGGDATRRRGAADPAVAVARRVGGSARPPPRGRPRAPIPH